jgi:23S rRNA (adenine2030-N6)-methyltransferase
MNYRHAFHAGNHRRSSSSTSCSRLIALMSRKEQPFAYIDTHAGLGLYDLQGDQASRTGEYLEGVARLWNRDDLPAVTADYWASSSA